MTDGQEMAASLDEAVEQAMERWQVPGVAVAVRRAGVVDARGYGITSLETRQPVTANTLFQIGSISKVFTVTLVMRLVEDGLVELDAPIATYVPDVVLADKRAPQSITLRHLLSHTSGLEGDRFEDPYGTGDDALARAVAEFTTLRQITPPGETWSYCNNGFCITGAIVERVTETTFEAAMRERVLEPLKMTRAFFFAHEAITYPVAVGHLQEPGAEPEIARHYPLPRFVNPAGGIISTVEDLLRFAAFHLDGGVVDGERLLAEESVREMQRPQAAAANFAAAYGLGWAHYYDDGQTLGHGGSTNGFQAQLMLAPRHDFAIAVLTNGAKGAEVHREIETWALAHYCGLRRPEPRLITLPAAELAPFAGRYRTPYTEMAVSARDGALRVEMTAQNVLEGKETTYPPILMEPISAREFIVSEGEWQSMRADFIGAAGSAPRFLRIGGRLADRVED